MKDSSQTTILMADDDPSHLMLAEAALAGAGFMVQTVGDGADAVEQFEQVKPDFVVLDVNMPRMSGVDACRAIRKLPGGQTLPILMLTGRNDLTTISDAYAAGASDFTQKGLNPRLLVERVRFLLRDRALQDELVSSRSKLLLAQRIARVGHWELAVEGQTIHVSPVLGEILGSDADALRRYEDFVALLDRSEREQVRQAFIACATGHGRFSFDHRLRGPADGVVYIHQEAELVPGADGTGTVIVTLQDVTRLYRAEEAVRQLSYSDPATGLPNRRHLTERIALAVRDGAGGVCSAVVALRVHNFDRVLLAQGNEYANQLLARVARLMEGAFAGANDAETVPWSTEFTAACRIADGELAVLLRGRASQEQLAGLVQSVLRTAAKSAAAPGAEYVPAVSAGIAFASPDAGDAEQLLQNAHVAAGQAEDPWSTEVFSPLPLARTRKRLQIESALRGAVERNEFSLVYQPRVATDTFDLMGVECLLRWQHKQLGSVPPDEFIPVAESAGLVDEIFGWALDEACRRLALWRKAHERDFFVSLNLTGRQLRNPQLVATILTALDRCGLPHGALEIELKESCVVESPHEARAVIEALRAAGVRIAIDDFGAGYSSLTLIRQVPFDCMKLDRALVADLYGDLGAQGITAAIIAMARGLKVRSVAEGVEDSATLQMLSALGCDELQGYYVSAPLAPKDFDGWLEAGGASDLASRHVMDIVSALEVADR